jgi:hypothetical protein
VFPKTSRLYNINPYENYIIDCLCLLKKRRIIALRLHDDRLKSMSPSMNTNLVSLNALIDDIKRLVAVSTAGGFRGHQRKRKAWMGQYLAP